MSKIFIYWQKPPVLFFIGVWLILSPSLSHAQERIRENLSNLQRDSSFVSSSAAQYFSGSYTVPDGKTLVIEHIFIELNVPAGVKATGKVEVVVSTTTSVAVKRYPFLFTAQGTNTSGKSILIASNPMKLYVVNRVADPATITVRLQVRPQSSGTSTGQDIAISGFLEPTTP